MPLLPRAVYNNPDIYTNTDTLSSGHVIVFKTGEKQTKVSNNSTHDINIVKKSIMNVTK